MNIKFLSQWPSRLKTRDLALNVRKQEANINIVRRGVLRCRRALESLSLDWGLPKQNYLSDGYLADTLDDCGASHII